jgi:hypothetical protein
MNGERRGGWTQTLVENPTSSPHRSCQYSDVCVDSLPRLRKPYDGVIGRPRDPELDTVPFDMGLDEVLRAGE